MIYITGDTHGEYTELERRAKRVGAKAGDTLIVCGDFGFVWGDFVHNMFLDLLSEKPYTIAFVDGNHENFDMLYGFPTVNFNGGKAHEVRKNIFHLMRGECFTFEGHSFFCFGGAYSIDKAGRTKGISWWEQEKPNIDEYNNAAKTLDKFNYKVDYVLTHTMPESFVRKLGLDPDPHDAELTGYFERLYGELDFKKWFAGHFHEDRDFGELRVIYGDVVRI